MGFLTKKLLPSTMKNEEEIVVQIQHHEHHQDQNQNQNQSHIVDHHHKKDKQKAQEGHIIDHHHKKDKGKVVEEGHIDHHEHKKRGCRPIAFLLGVPFAICGVLLSLAGGLVWILGSLLAYVCPCLQCCADISNSTMDLIKAPIHVFTWFIDKIPF